MIKQNHVAPSAATRPVVVALGLGETGWENEGGSASATERPRLYADLLAEADRRRRAADDAIVQRMVAVRDSQP